MAEIVLRYPQTGQERNCVGVFDTGASFSAIPSTVAQHLNLKIDGHRPTTTVGSKGRMPFSWVEVVLSDDTEVRPFLVPATVAGHLADNMILIGRDIICQGIFCMDDQQFSYVIE